MRNLFDGLIKWTLAAVMYAALGTMVVQAQTPELPLGSAMPMADRAFANAAGGQTTLGDLRGANGTVVVFWSNQCPWVDKYRDRVSALIGDFRAQGLGFVLVNSNDAAAYPRESIDESRSQDLGVPYLMDTSSELARAFGAERTPHVYVFDAANALVYVGTIDDSPGDPGNVRQTFLREALTAQAGGGTIAVPQTKAFGCLIKYKN